MQDREENMTPFQLGLAAAHEEGLTGEEAEDFAANYAEGFSDGFDKGYMGEKFDS